MPSSGVAVRERAWPSGTSPRPRRCRRCQPCAAAARSSQSPLKKRAVAERGADAPAVDVLADRRQPSLRPSLRRPSCRAARPPCVLHDRSLKRTSCRGRRRCGRAARGCPLSSGPGGANCSAKSRYSKNSVLTRSLSIFGKSIGRRGRRRRLLAETSTAAAPCSRPAPRSRCPCRPASNSCVRKIVSAEIASTSGTPS